VLETNAYGFSHAEVSSTMLRNWRFPLLLAKCVQYHHQPMEASDAQREAATICLGDVLAHSSDHPLPPHIISPAELDQAMALLSITSDDMSDYAVRMRQNWEVVNSLVRG
jgi:HD-like signal output (HDOD) protein